MEALEGRQLLAGVAMGTDGILNLSAANNQRNTITVTTSGSNIIAKVNATSKTVAASAVKEIKITGGNWNDTITVATTITKRTNIDGNAGDDKIIGGNGIDKVYGDIGHDSIYGNGGNDSLFGDAGNDLLDGGTGTDSLNGGTGTNTLKNGETAAPAPTTNAAANITALEIWNAATRTKVQTLTSGSTLDLAKLPAKFTLIAQGTAGSVKFGVDSNGNYRIENGKPWSISGGTTTALSAWTIGTGSHTVKVTPYTKSGATGTAGAAKTYTFNVIRSSTPVPSSPTPTPAPTPAPSTGGIVPRNTLAAAPEAIIARSSDSTTIHAGQSFHANAMSSKLNNGTPLTARYVWDFADPGSKYNIMEGFNASHYYTKPGTYDVKLTLTNEAGKSDSTSMKVTVLAAGRKKIYVSTTGSDSNDGLSEAKPIKTFDKARSKVADNVEILFKGGSTFEVKSGMSVYRRNVVLGSYGTGKATLKYTGGLDYDSMIWLGGGGGETTVQNLVFDSIYTGISKAGLPQAVGINGTGNTIINNEFRNLGYAVNAFSQPKALLVQDNDAPLKTGLRGYFAWAGGEDLVFQGNVVANVDGHVIRMADINRVNVNDNDFTNPNETSGYRGTLTIHSGSYAYVRNNRLNDGWFSVGPLGNEDGLNAKASRFNWSVFENNTINRSRFIVLHGANHTMFRNNVVKVLDNDWGIEIQGFNTEYNRGVSDVEVVNNTMINNGAAGNFIRVSGAAEGISVVNNLYVAPHLLTGTGGAAPVFVYDNSLSSFDKITNNVWAMPTMNKYAEGGINYVWPIWSNAAGYKTPAEWNALGVVGTDYFEDIGVSSTYAPSTSASYDNIGTVWGGVFTDRNGKIRSNTGGWTVGAVEA
ncbi:MAG: hypothetical protein QOF78_2346 [Phycisphaerales bacterium]|nr:hypothetical protein [Phycisphaerales bacterium]